MGSLVQARKLACVSDGGRSSRSHSVLSLPTRPLPSALNTPRRENPGAPVAAQVMKNWQPLVLGPELAMLSRPGPVCRPVKFSSANRVP